jgi:hypothetical protein
VLSECREWKLTVVTLKSSKKRNFRLTPRIYIMIMTGAGKPESEPETAKLLFISDAARPGSTAARASAYEIAGP